jgi:hypothetical protein
MRGGICEVTRLKSELQFKPFVYLNARGGDLRHALRFGFTPFHDDMLRRD